MSYNEDDTMSIKVGIVDDHPSFAYGLLVFLNSIPGIKAILDVNNGLQLLAVLKDMTDLPDILLMDVMMDEMNGIETTKQVTALYPAIKTVAFSANNGEWPIIKMIGAGACAYLSKDITNEQLVLAIHEVHRSGKYKADLYHMHSAALRKRGKDLQDLSFTEKEIRVLQLLCKGYTYAQMAEELHVTSDGIKYIFTSLYGKLHAKNQAGLVLEALRLGIISLQEGKKA